MDFVGLRYLKLSGLILSAANRALFLMHQTGAGCSSTQVQQIRNSVTGTLEICNERHIEMISEEKPTCAAKCKTLLYCTPCVLLFLVHLQFIVFTIYVCLKGKLDFSGGCSRALLLLSWGYI